MGFSDFPMTSTGYPIAVAGRGGALTGIGMWHLQDNEIDVIRKTLWGAFSELNNQGLAPMWWGNLTASGTDLMNSIMKKTHPIFRLANNGWKLHYLAMSSYPSWRRNHVKNVDSSVSPIIPDPELPAAGASTSPATGSSGSGPTEPVLELPAASPSTSPAVESPGLDSTEPVQLELPTAGPSMSLATELPELDPKEPVSDSATAASASPLSLLQKLNHAFESSPCAGASLPLQPPVPNFLPVAPSPLAQHSTLEVPAVGPRAVPRARCVLAKPKMDIPQEPVCLMTEEFNAYYNSLTSTQRTEYDQDAANLVASNTWNKTVCDGEIH
ncbi:hypothetical protein C8R48DRAFT_674922 [Suillus tomentosus]|nr:hypothetical protein C8R48DRAFT_674922 [Suillus tomentosus]